MADDRLPKRAAELREQGRRRRGRPRLRWEDCVKRDVRKTGRRRQETEEGGKDYQMRRWKSSGQHLTPDKGKRGRERVMYTSWSQLKICTIHDIRALVLTYWFIRYYNINSLQFYISYKIQLVCTDLWNATHGISVVSLLPATVLQASVSDAMWRIKKTSARQLCARFKGRQLINVATIHTSRHVHLCTVPCIGITRNT